jgi:hypothetical protein
LRATAKVVLGNGRGANYAQRILVDLEAARRRSFAAVMEVRRGAGKDYILPSGHEKYQEVRDVAVGLQSDVLADLPESERERFLEQLEVVAMACRRAAETSAKTISR